MTKFNQTFRFLDARVTRACEGAPPPPRKCNFWGAKNLLWNIALVGGGAVTVVICPIDGSDPANDHCTLQAPGDPCGGDPDCLEALLEGEADEDEKIKKYTGLLKRRIELEQYEEAQQDLEAEARDESYKTLTATYEKEGNYALAHQKLQQIPEDKPANIAFKQLYTEILNGIAPPAGSDKAMSKQEQDLRSLKSNPDAAISAQADAVIATFYGEPAIKKLPVFKLDKNASIPQPKFKLSPNPANGQVVLTTTLDNRVDEKLTLQVSNVYGGVVLLLNDMAAETSINTATWQPGIYFFRLYQGTASLGVQKLIVIP